jgi:predicted transcriptional regulator
MLAGSGAIWLGVQMTEQDGAAAGLGPLEAEVMAVLWRSGTPLPVREVASALNARRPEPLAYTTVMTVMTRLAGKGLLARSRSGRRFVYTPIVADTAEIAVQGVLERFGDAALARFVERAELDPALRERLRRLAEET